MRKLILAERNELLLVRTASGFRLPTEAELMHEGGDDIFEFGGYMAMPIGYVSGLHEEMERRGLRETWGMMPEKQYAAAAKGIELLNWNSEERFCARDGVRLERYSEISKRCPRCGSEYFPRLNPAVVVLVKRGEEALLVHARTLRNPVMALVAGFVETGESLEECVRREVREETSLEIKAIRYYGSQSWPFPHQLMVGFIAEYESGELEFADGELTEGGFFTRENPPAIPSRPSLSRMIIDAWVKGEI